LWRSGIILMLLSTTSAIVKVWRIYLVAQSAPKALLPSMLPSPLNPPAGPLWAKSFGSFLSKSRRTPTSTCVAAAIYNNYHQMNKQTFVPLLSWTSDKGKAEPKAPLTPRPPHQCCLPSTTQAPSHPKD